MKCLGVYMCRLTISAKIGHRQWPNLAKMSKHCVSKYELVRASYFDENHRGLVIGLNKTPRGEDVPFDNFGTNRPPENGRIGPKCPKQRFYKYKLVRARTFERQVTETLL